MSVLRLTDSDYPFGIFKLFNQVMGATVKLSRWWRNYGVLDQLRDIYSICMCFYIYIESSQWGNLNHTFCRYVSFLSGPHCQLRRVDQGMNETYLIKCVCTQYPCKAIVKVASNFANSILFAWVILFKNVPRPCPI